MCPFSNFRSEFLIFPLPATFPHKELLDNTRKKYNDYNMNDHADYEGRLKDSFFKYIKRTKNYDRNEVPWEEDRGSKPVQIEMSAYLRKISSTKLYISITKI